MSTEVQPSKSIRLEVDDSGFGTLTIGDDDISNAVNEVTIVSRVGKPNLVTCQENEPGVRVEMGIPALAFIAAGHAEVKLRDEEQAALVALGWTPPAEEA